MTQRGATLFQFDKRLARTLKVAPLNTTIVGIDEAGRGPWAGPVVACAVLLPPYFFHPDLADSKILPAPKRAKIHQDLLDLAQWALGVVEVDLIDSLNILRATHLAMKKAFDQLISKYPKIQPNMILVDGLPIPPLGNYKQKSIVKGDRLSASIAAASIIAKVERDKMMEKYDQEYPSYGFAKHKGYGTKYHQKKLLELGPTPIHRKSFSPVLAAMRKYGNHLAGRCCSSNKTLTLTLSQRERGYMMGGIIHEFPSPKGRGIKGEGMKNEAQNGYKT